MKHLVCRCEDVTLEELEHAVALGHDDIESLKRYTGFGTGWCQGKWCLALCARHLARLGGDPGHGITPRPPFHPIALADLAGLDPDALLAGGTPETRGAAEPCEAGPDDPDPSRPE